MTLLLASILYVLSWSGIVYSNTEPFLKPCRQSDAVCLNQSAQKAIPLVAAGVPELGMLPLDPGYIEHMATNEAGLHLEFNKTIIRGLKDCTLLSLRRYTNRTSIDLKCSVTLVGDYSLGGQLLILPIEGAGRYKIVIQDIIVKTDLHIEEVVRDGKRYWNVTGWKHSIDMPTSVRYRFQNLFRGNKQLSDQIHRFANDNWRDIFREVAPPITKAIVFRIVEETSKLFSKVPINELVLDE